MRRLLLLLCFAILPLVATCPAGGIIYIAESEPIRIFDPMLWAFQKVESNFDSDVINWLGYAGILQEGQEMIDEANRICEIKNMPFFFTYSESALNPNEAIQIWYIVMEHRNPEYQLKSASKIWNPLASQRYYKKTKEALITALTNQMILKLFEDYKK